jgi:hypothetical protein
MQFSLRAIFILIAILCGFIAAASAFGAAGAWGAVGMVGYLTVVFQRDRPVLQRATVLLFGTIGGMLFARGLPHVLRGNFSSFLKLDPYEMLMVGSGFLVGAFLACRLFIIMPPEPRR